MEGEGATGDGLVHTPFLLFTTTITITTRISRLQADYEYQWVSEYGLQT
jgi:hypothetical protein